MFDVPHQIPEDTLPLLVSSSPTVVIALSHTVGDGVTAETAVSAHFVEACDGSSDSHRMSMA